MARAEPERSGVPELTPEEGWVPLDPAKISGRGHTFVSGPGNGNRVRVRYFRCDPASTLAGKVWFGPDAEGRPGHVHSGCLAAVLEDAMGLAAWLRGFDAWPVAGTIRYRRMMPLGLVCTLGAWVTLIESEKIQVRALLGGPTGQSFADAEGVLALQRPY